MDIRLTINLSLRDRTKTNITYVVIANIVMGMISF